jgi:hypothetical protein
LADERTVVAARAAGLDDVDLVVAEEVPDLSDLPDVPDAPEVPATPAAPAGAGRAEQQLAVLAVRLEMAAVYLRLVRG